MDTKTTFTPGKWEVLDGAIVSQHVNTYGNFIIVGCERERTPEDEANLQLIASAPDLLAALEACSRIRLTSMLDAGEFQAIEWARTAIAKAKGD